MKKKNELVQYIVLLNFALNINLKKYCCEKPTYAIESIVVHILVKATKVR